MKAWTDDQYATVHSDERCGTSKVIYGAGYHKPGSVACEVKDTGNGFIARFPAGTSVQQDYFLCMDYDQARNLVIALEAFKKDLGFV